MNTIFATLQEIISWEQLLAKSLRVMLLLVLALIVIKVLKKTLGRLEKKVIAQKLAEGRKATEESKRAETIMRLAGHGAVIFIWTVATLVILQELGVEIGAILASAGIVGIILGFGAQNLVRDIIAGFFLIFENQVRVGDVAIVNGTGGLVEKINFRKVDLRDLSGVVHIFPNGTITTLANMTNEWSAYILDIGVAYKENVDQVIEIMKEVGAGLKADPLFGPQMLEDIEIFGVDAFAESAVIIKARLKTKPIQQWLVGREYRRRLKHAFDSHGIEIPFPHRSLYFGEASRPVLAQLLDRQQSTPDARSRHNAETPLPQKS
jgi:moderate conductance mechanosensitive channel